ncbi:uncharacterized protein LOC131951597 [Physella acuta]|uniref:uncharacterized protein LOC131951597 n=1 Tax=Physella acuta TaxID=109671 RepID=UPI0027DCDB40|nr:uncharacterized protein LOC131951597 [Physella acuta]XP_059169916.1 uncharacterized protein LOC131951597 [Physella acuta]XP_059169923.1 uncharacterized protein LOC131951597 [Physella acuta]XP_059169931.1 uncharacterized protein LOC131951597 [Physella acuta]
MTQRTSPRRYQSHVEKSPTTNSASCDFTIMVDGAEFKSHQEILSSTSAYFDALFRSNMRETKEGRVELQGMTSETFAVVLNFIHQRVHGLTADNIDDIWDAANRLDIAIYLKEIEHFDIDSLSIDNLWHFYLKAVDVNSNYVKDGSLKFIKQNYEHVFRMKGFLNLPFPLVLSCIESEELNVRTEDSVLESILIWVSHGKYQQGDCLTRDSSDKRAACKDDELKNTEGPSHDDTTSSQSGSLIKVGQNFDDGNVADAGETATDTPGISVRKHGQHGDVKNEDHTDDVTKCNQTGDRASYLAKLMSSAKLTLATASCLQSLLKNPYIIQCTEAYHGIQEALKYKCGVYPLESAILTPLRTNSGKRNCLAFVKKRCLHLYDLESRTLSSTKLENVKRSYRNFVSVVSLGSRLAFLCVQNLRNCPFAMHKCNLFTVLLLNENKTLSTLYELCNQQNAFLPLFSANNQIICVKKNDRYAATRSRIVDPCMLKTITLNPGRNFFPVCMFENEIVMYEKYFMSNNLTHDLTVKTYNLETKTLTTTKIPNVGGQIFHIVAIHKDKDTFLLLSSGLLLSVKRDSNKAVKFTPVAHLWRNVQKFINGAVIYKNELIMFCSEWPMSHLTVLTTVPGLFNKISVVELREEILNKDMVPVIAPVSWFR